MEQVAAAKKERLLDYFYNALGDIKQYLDDPDVTDIMLNPDGKLWLDTMSKGQIFTDKKLAASQAEQIIRIASGINGAYFAKDKPSVATELPIGGERFQGVMPPQVQAPTFAIRKRPQQIFSLEDYLVQQLINEKQYLFLLNAIQAKKNILVAGPTGSGKTTFANAVLHEVAKLNTRIAILEDTIELQCAAKNSFSFKTSEHADMSQLLKDTLRMNIDSIVVGEIRGKEALDLLKAWNTGHSGGVATIHSDSAVDALYRLEQLMLEVVAGSQHNLIARSIDIVVFLAKSSDRKRKVKEVLELDGLIQEVQTYKFMNVK